MTNHLVFHDRIVVFVDILGFGSLVEEAARKPDGEVSKRLKRALNIIDNLQSTQPNAQTDSKTANRHPFFELEPHLQMFSDSFFLSLKPSKNAVEAMFHQLSRLYIYLMNEGIWIRGGLAFRGISTGQLSPCGPAINDAYRIESQIAKTPRIAFAKRFVEYCREVDPTILESDYVERNDDDGVYALAPLKMATASDEARAELGIDIRDYGSSICEHLNDSLQNIVDNPNHYSKISNLANDWSDKVSPVRNFFTKDCRTKSFVDFLGSWTELPPA